MEEHRCKVVAAKTADLRCGSLLAGAQIEVEDRRYTNLHRLVDIEVEDSRCNNVSVALDDPRCQSLASKW